MNNIYKVIWSKAKNCYVVASEIAKSHTKSASGSEKMGGYGKRALLALAAASAIFCGGLVNVGAADTVHVDESSTPATAQEVYTKAAVDTALDKKADKDSVYTKADTYTKTEVDTELAKKADAANVYTKADTYTKTEVNTAVDKKADKDSVYTKAETYTKTEVNAELAKKADASNVFTKEQTFTKDQVNTKLADYAKTTDVNTALAGKANVGDSYTKDEADGKFATSTTLDTAKNELDGKITANTAKITANETAITNLNNKAATTDTALTNLSGRMTTAESDIGTLKADMTTAKSDIGTLTADVSTAKSDINTLKAKDTELTGKIEAEIANRITSDTALDNKIDAEIANRITSDTALDNKINTEIQDRKDAIKDTNDRTGGIKRNTEKTQTTIEGIVKVDNQGNVKDVKGLAAETITTSGNADLKGNVILGTNTANTVTVNGNADFNEAVNMDKGLTVTSGDTTLKGTKVDGKLTVTDETDLKNTKVDGTLTTTGKATFQEAVEMDKGLTVTSGDTTLKGTKVDGKLTVTDEADLKNTKVDGTLGVTGATTLSGELTAEKNATFEKDVTVKGTTNLKDTTVDGDLKVTGTITTDKMIFGDKATNNYTEIDHGKVTSKNLVVNGAGETISSSSTFNAKENKVGFANSATGEQSSHKQTSDMIVDNVKNNITGDQSFHKQTSDVIMDNVKDLHNSNNRTQTKTETKDIITDKDGNSSTTSQTASENKTYLKDKDGKNTNSTIDTAKGYDKTIKGENGETSTKQDEFNITNTAQNGTITNDAQNIVNNASGNITNKANTMDTNVTGKATESYGSLDTTVNGNETHIVKGTKTETVDGMVTENYKAGQATNVTGDQTTNVSGTQTTTATDINRNASSSMVDKVDNAYGTNTETKVAGKTTTDVSIKGTGEKGQYIRGANESRDYLINGTLKNSETKTVEKTSTEITDGNGKTSATVQDVTDLAGSVTNGKETGVSGIHANDDSVSIDSIVTDGNKSYSVINQKKGSIQSTVVDGTSSTVILQDKDNVTIASSNGTVGLVGKDIVNNAQNTITNTAGTSITNQVNDSKVTTDANGTTFENNTPAVSDSGATTTKINGNQITTGRVNANELDVSDTDGNNKADLLVKAGEGKGVNASASDGNTTGSLDVKADGITTSITNGTDHNTVSSTLAGGTIFTNSEAAAPVTGASGAGTAVNTTIKGNTITTGKVTMDYAEVMKDLGVRGNANITGKTTTGSLEVTGTSTLKGDVTMESNATVKKDLKVEGITNTKTLNVTEDANVGRDLAVGGNATISGDVTARSYKVDGKTYIDANGIHANGQKITDVADGSISEGSKDAVNGGQLYGVKRDLEHQVDKVGANAAAMANLRPMEFDPSSKWNIAAAIGNYGSETAAALGAFYRPNDDVMVNLSTAFGTGENMVGGGVSVRLGKSGNKLSREENNALKAQVDDLTARMDALLSVLNPNMSKDFPDVPENHWAYEAVSRLAGNDIVQGYPDGEFHGERTMTRYEMAEIIYNALSRGAEAERELVEEFKPELQAMAASEKATAEKAEG